MTCLIAALNHCKRLFHLIAFLSLFISVSRSQSFIYYNYSDERGLPSTEAYDVMCDKDGFIWVATDRGVCRFDGYKFRTFSLDDGLTDNTVFNFYEDKTGRIWFLTFNGRLCYYYNDTIYKYRYSNVIDKVDAGKLIRSFYLEGDTLHIGFLHQGELTIYPNGTSKHLMWADSSNLHRITEYKNSLMLSTHGPALPSTLKNKPKQNFIHIQTADTVLRYSYFRKNHGKSVRALKRRNGSYIIYTSGRLTELRNGRLTHINTDIRDVIGIFETKDSSLWISYRNEGVRYYPPNENIATKEALTFFPDKSVSGIAEDREGGLWLTTLNSGLFYVPFRNHLMMDPELGMNSSFITGNKNEFCIIYKNGNLYKLKLDGYKATWERRGRDSKIFSSAVYFNSKWVFGSNDGISILEDELREYRISASKRLLISNDSSALWSLGSIELLKYSVNNLEYPEGSWFLPERADAMFQDIKNTLWIGTQKGLYRFNPKEQKIERPFKHKLLDVRISDILQLSTNELIVATLGNGVLFIQPDGTIKQISTGNGLTSGIINSVCMDNEFVWVATNKGLNRIGIKNHNDVKAYSISNGLPSLELRHIYNDGTYLWLATAKGTVRIKKSELFKNETMPVVWLTSVNVAEKKLQPKNANNLVLPHDFGYIRIEFTGLAYRKRGEVTYRFRLAGLSDKWQYTHVPFVLLTSLYPGNYTFEVYAQNENGVWSEKPAQFSFHVESPYWKTWWFLTLSILAFLTIVYLIFYIRLRQQRQKAKLLSTIENLRLQALASQMNPHFIFNSLTSIQSFVLKADTDTASTYLSRFSRLMRMELENIRNEFVPVSKEMEMLRHYLDLERLRFSNMFEYFLETKNIKESAVYIPSMLIQPFLENAIVHGLQYRTTKGKVSVMLSEEDGRLWCRIEDNGIGRIAAQKKTSALRQTHESVGMEITEKRLKLLCESLEETFRFSITDKINPSSGEAEGTLIEFIIPCKKREQV